MQLYEKLIIFFAFFIAFSKSALNFEYFEKKEERHSSSISEIVHSQMCVYFNA